MKTSHFAAILTAVLALAAGTALADFKVPLDLSPNNGADGMRVVSNGVPLLAGAAMDTKELHLLGPGGKEIPAQFRVLARWWRGDKSIRWVLMSFVRSQREGAKPVYTLVGRKAVAKRPGTKMRVTETKNAIRITTGPARFEISTTGFNLLNRVELDADGDGAFDTNETIVHPDPKLGSVVEDADGRKYYSALGTDKVRILEQGPVMVKVMAQGRHISKEAGAFKPGLYGYEITMTFWVGKPYCNIEAIITNNPAKMIGEPHFEDWSILTRLGKGGSWSFARSHKEKLTGDAGKASSVLLYQDSIGAKHWKQATGLRIQGKAEDKPQLQTFRGYKVWRLEGDKREELEQGDFADGIAIFRYGQGTGCTISPRYFWQQFPSAIQYGSDGVVRLSPFPREYKMVHWIEDASAKAQEFQLCFLPDDKKATVNRLVTPKRYQKRVFALPSTEHCGAAGALSDLGPYMMHEKIAGAVKNGAWHKVNGADQSALHPKANGYGWQVFGARWQDRWGHSPNNYEPLATSGGLWSYLVSRNPRALEHGLRVDRHFRDVRSYHIEGQDNIKLWKTFKPGYWNNCSVEHFSRMAPGVVDSRIHPDIKAHPYQRGRWPLPNMSHMNLDEVYDLYLLTGDDRSLRCMRTIADHGYAWATLKGAPTRTYRDEGWCLRSLARYYELTGDPKYKVLMTKTLNKFWKDIDKAGAISQQGGTWYQGVYARGVMVAWHATGDERMRDLAIGCADWAMTYEVAAQGYPYMPKPNRWSLKPSQRGRRTNWANGYFIDLHAFAYSQTGDKKYVKAFDFAWKMNGGHHWLGYFPSSLHMIYGPRPDKTAPAAVTNLKAKAVGGKVTLTWTAPGDDGKKGKASVYQIKHGRKPILDFVPWPEKRKTHIAFWGAENVSDEPAPGPVGRRESYTFKGLKPGKHYFALKARDECNNQSEISNVVSVEIDK